MMEVKLIEKKIIKPEQETEQRRIFLSRLDIALVSYQESAQFFDPPPINITFSHSYRTLYKALSRLLVSYDFFAGRLSPSLEDNARFEIDCNGAGILVAVARTETKLQELGDILSRKPDYDPLVSFLHEETDLHKKPLLHIQFTEFGCGSLALASSYNHCILDGLSVHEFEINLAALTRDINASLKQPNPDRTIFKAREPPKISYPHYEYSKPSSNLSSTTHSPFNTYYSDYKHTHMVYISRQHISNLKKAAMEDGFLKSCTTFQVVSARLWKARTIALRMTDDAISTLLFPVDARRIVHPPLPAGFAGNAVVPGFARLSVKELKEASDSFLVRKVQEGLERLNDEYVRSSIDWLELHRGTPTWENSFSVAQWFRLALDEETYSWGTARCAVPIGAKPGLVVLLSGPKDKGGLSVCLELQDDQLHDLTRLVME
ncbi:Acyltransferase GLAUCE [Linum perenne]